MPRKTKPDLSTLSQHIIKVSAKWYRNSHSGAFIPSIRITDHLPKPKPKHEDIIAKRWDLRVDLHEVDSDGMYMRVVEGH